MLLPLNSAAPLIRLGCATQTRESSRSRHPQAAARQHQERGRARGAAGQQGTWEKSVSATCVTGFQTQHTSPGVCVRWCADFEFRGTHRPEVFVRKRGGDGSDRNLRVADGDRASYSGRTDRDVHLMRPQHAVPLRDKAGTTSQRRGRADMQGLRTIPRALPGSFCSKASSPELPRRSASLAAHTRTHSIKSPQNCLGKGLPVRTWRLRGLCAKIRGPNQDKSDRVAS